MLALAASWLMAAIAFAAPARSNGAATTFEREAEVDHRVTEVLQAIAEVWRAIQISALDTGAPNNPIAGKQLLRRVHTNDITEEENSDRTSQFPGSAGMTRQLNTRSALV